MYKIMSVLEKLQRKKGKKWVLFYFAFIINFVLIEVMIMMLGIYWGDINLIVSDILGFNINLVFIVMGILLIPIIYGMFLFSSNLKELSKSDEIIPKKIHKILPIFLMVIFSGAFILLLYSFEQYSILILQLMEYYSIYIFLVICIILLLLLYSLVKILPRVEDYLSDKIISPNTKSYLILVLIIASYVLAFASPLLFIPANVLPNFLPTKPRILAHRGASRIAPENTIIAGELAEKYGAVGWEVDIRISYDGQLFLMHDDTLTRTTNVDEVFPNRKNDEADSFKWKDLKELDAGSWFAEKDPFGTIASGFISKEKADEYMDVKIPTFEEVLEFTKDSRFLIDLDTKGTSEGHPYAEDYFELILNATLNSGIDLEKVMLATDNIEWIDLINDRNASDIILAMNMRTNPTLEEFRKSEYDYEFVKTGDLYTNKLYREFYDAEVPVVVYTINSPERFYQLWCLGVSFVMGDNVHVFNSLIAPTWYMNIKTYVTIWLVVYSVALCYVIVLKFVILKKKTD